MTAAPGRSRDAGLTLVEVLVGLALFALVSLAGANLLNTVLRVNAGTEARLERLVEIDRALLVLRRDLAQLAPGAVTLGPEVFSFLRAEGEGLARQDLRLEAGRLLRVLRAEEGGTVDQRLLGGVAGARWRLLDRGGRWRDSWPPAGQSEAEAPGAPPVAAELTLRLDAPGQVEAADLVRLFALPGAAQR